MNENFILETINMVKLNNLDIRTVTLAISLRDCMHPDVDVVCDKIYRKITTYAKNLVTFAQEIEEDYSIPIINKRILCAHNRSYTFFFVPVHCIFIARIKFLPVSFKFLKLSLSLISTGIADCPERVKVFYFRNRSMIKLAIFPNI